MNVTFVMDGGDNLSGGHRAIAMFADGLRRLGHHVSLIARPQRPPSLRDKIRSLVREGSLPSGPGPRPSHFRTTGVPLRVIKDWRPIRNDDLPDADVVVATWWETVEWVWALDTSKGVKVQLMQDYEEWGGPREAVDRSCGLPLPKIVTSPWLPELLETRFHQKALALVPYGVSRTEFHAEPRGKQAVPTVGLIYSTIYRKGSDSSIQAFELAQRTVPELRLVAAGNVPVSRDLPLPAAAHYESHADYHTLRGLYSHCDAWLFGTRKEGFGLPILEAMACRTPVIGTPAGAAPELLRDGAGILVKADDPADMARAIEMVCRLSDREWRAMSDAAEAKAAAYTWESAVEKFEAALKQALRDSRTRAGA
jgi:glycosyltransferase involved in cell wall biosynthesis